MADDSATTFVNRDEPLPIFHFDAEDDLSDKSDIDTSTSQEGKRARLKKKISSARLQVSDARVGLQDKLLESYVYHCSSHEHS